MNTWLEIIKYCIPSIIVFLGFYYAYQSFFKGQLALKQQEIAAKSADQNRAAQLQAYERLMLLCERVNPYHMRMRLEVPGMSGAQLAHSMQLAIAQEFDHNVSQQLYVSSTLWKILEETRGQLTTQIDIAAKSVDNTASADDLMAVIDQQLFALGKLPTDLVKQAIKREAGVMA